MSYFLFGPNAESWAIGNTRWNAYQNLPTSFSKFFENQTLTANTVQWFSTGPNGICCFCKSDGTFLSSQDQNLLSDLRPSNLYGLAIQQVDYLSFSPEGGWFVRYVDGTVRLSMVGGFHENFHSLAKEYMQTRGPAASSKQSSQLQWVFFGADGAVIFVLSNGNVRWIGIPEALAAAIREEVGLGWSVAKQTTLCHWDKTYYYLKLTKSYGLENRTRWNIKPTGILNPVLLREVAEGTLPVSYTSQPKTTPIPAQIPKSDLARNSSTAWALYDGERQDNKTISFTKGERFTNVRRKTDDWLTGTNEKGESGMFPRVFVTVWAQPSQSLVKCDDCGKDTKGAFYHCSICSGCDWDLCYTCGEKPQWGTKKCYDEAHTISLQAQGMNAAGEQIKIICEDKDWKQTIRAGGLELLDRIFLEDDNQLPDLSSLNINTSNPSLQPAGKPEKEENEYEKELSGSLDGAIITESPNVHWDDIAGLDQAKEELQTAVVLPITHPQLFKGARKAKTGILLFGPPGTGKSYLAKACATEIKCTFFSISCSSIMSKWTGESERNVKTLFKKARQHKPAIIFIDEIDSLGGVRDETDAGGDASMGRVKTEFLVQMDGVGNNSTGVMVLAATNLPWKLDPALRRRFQRRIHIGLPDLKARVRMFENGIGDTACDLTPQDYHRLAEMTAGFSGSDISIVTQDALEIPVKKIASATHFKKVYINNREMLTPCASYDSGAVRMRFLQVPPDKLLEPSITSADFFAVVQKSRSSVAGDELAKYTKWTADFGSEGA